MRTTEMVSRLEALRSEILEKIEREQATLAIDPESRGEDLTPSQHPADVASDLFARESLISAERRFQADLNAVEDALRRVRQGTYGICADCGRPIAPERLEILPQALRCVECQRNAGRAVRAG